MKKQIISKIIPITLLLLAIIFTPSLAQAASGTWSGATDALWTNTPNWSASPAPGTDDTATFNGPGNGNTIIDLTGGVTISNILFDTASAAVYTIGSGSTGTQTLTLGQVNGGITMSSTVTSNQVLNANLALPTIGFYNIVNNSAANTLTLAGTNTTTSTGSTVLTVDGTGTTVISGPIVAGTGAMGLQKTNSGTLILSGGGAFAATNVNDILTGASYVPVDLRQGTTIISSGTYTNTGEFVVGGVIANGGAGNNVNLTLNGGSLGVSTWFSLGRGNGIGGVSSDLVLNNSASIVAGNISCGYNAGNVTNLPKGTVALNNSSTVTILGNGGVNFAESLGSDMTMTLSNSAQFIATGTGQKNLGYSGKGTVTLNDSSSINFGNGTGYVGHNYGTGAVTVASSSASFYNGGELRIGGSDSSGTGRNANGTFTLNAGTVGVGSLTIGRGNDNQNGVNGVLYINGGTFTCTNDVLLAYAGAANSSGKIAMNGGTLNVGTTVTKWLRFGQYDFTSGEINITNGNLNLNTGTSIKYNQNGSTGPKTFNQYGGNVTFYSDFATTVGGSGNLDLMLASTATGINTYNLNGGTLSVPQIISSSATGSRIFNFNGGKLVAVTPVSPFFASGAVTDANVRDGGAIIDSGTNSITIGAALVHSTIDGDVAVDGGLIKNGSGTLTLAGGSTYTGNTIVNAGTLSLNGASVTPATVGSLTVNNAALTLDISSGTALPANNVTLQNNVVLNFNYGGLSATPSTPAINAAGSLSAAGSAITVNISAMGLRVGQFMLIKYTGTPLANLANFSLTLPPGVVATLVNNTANDSIDLNVTFAPYFLTWYGSVNTNWDIGTTANWKNGVLDMVYQQYTNGASIVGDAVLFNDTLYNDGINPQPTNVNLTTALYSFPVIVDNDNTLPYSFSGPGGITGAGYLVKSNSGSLTLNTSNSYTGGTFIYGGSVIITNDSALGANAGVVTLNGTTLQVNGNTTNTVRPFSLTGVATIGVATNVIARYGGVFSGSGGLTKVDDGTLTLAGANTYSGNTFVKAGTVVVDSGGVINIPSVWSSIGQDGSDNGTLTLKGTGIFREGFDFNVGDIGNAVGTLNIQDTATLTVNNLFVASANAAGSTASGTVNQTGGTVNQTNTAAGAFVIGGRNTASSLGVGVYNLIGGTVNAGSSVRVGANGTGTINQSGGTFNAAANGINIARLTGGVGTYNLNGGTLQTLNIASSTGTNAVFNFNGGTLKPATNNTTFFLGLSGAYVRDGGAVIDSSGFNITIAQPLLQSTNLSDVGTGGLTKKGSGTLTLTGTNTYTGTTAVSTGTLFVTPAHQVTGAVTVASNAAFGVVVKASGAATVGNLTLGSTSLDNKTTLAFALVTGSNPTSPVLQVGTLTLNGTNTVRLSGIVAPGTFPIVQYSGPMVVIGTAIFNTNVLAPQGEAATLSNDVVNSRLYVTVTGSPGIVWTGTNRVAALTNVWNLNSAINWLAAGVPTFYQEIIPPGDAVTFNDIGSGLVLLSDTASPASIQISNNAVNYAFRGTGHLSGTAGLTKQGSGTATISLSGNDYTGNTTVSGGTLQLGSATTLPDGVGTGSLIVNSAGTLNLAGFSETINGLSGSGIIDNSGGTAVLTMGNGNGAVTWPGTIAAGVGGTSIIKVGSGDSIITGTNYLTSTAASQVNGGTMLITNGGALYLTGGAEFWVMQNAGTATVIVDGGKLVVSNNWLVVGRNNIAAIGTLIVNSGLVQKAGANNIVVGSLGATGYLYVNGGQVLNNGMLWLGENTGANASLYLNGGLIQATQVRANGSTPTTSIAWFNGGTLQATASSSNFLQVASMMLGNGLVLDDNGFTLSIGAASLQDPGDGTSGGLLKKGAGTVYLDVGNSYYGTTVVTNGTLAGVGAINGPMIVLPAANLGAGDAGDVGIFTINNNLTLQGKATLRIKHNSTVGEPLMNDQVDVNGNITYGGTLTVNNITSDATPLTTSDTFPLFSVSGSTSGNFTSIVGSPGAGLAYSFNPASGLLSIVASSIASNPTNITMNVSGSTLTLSWPADHLGWILQSQTNNLGVGISTNWADVPGSDSITSTNYTVNPANPTVFYRLRHP